MSIRCPQCHTENPYDSQLSKGFKIADGYEKKLKKRCLNRKDWIFRGKNISNNIMKILETKSNI
jgi:hypothetical protein